MAGVARGRAHVGASACGTAGGQHAAVTERAQGQAAQRRLDVKRHEVYLSGLIADNRIQPGQQAAFDELHAALAHDVSKAQAASRASGEQVHRAAGGGTSLQILGPMTTRSMLRQCPAIAQWRAILGPFFAFSADVSPSRQVRASRPDRRVACTHPHSNRPADAGATASTTSSCSAAGRPASRRPWLRAGRPFHLAGRALRLPRRHGHGRRRHQLLRPARQRAWRDPAGGARRRRRPARPHRAPRRPERAARAVRQDRGAGV